MESIKALGISIIRTVVPVLVGQLMTLLAVIGIVDTTGEISAAAISFFTILFTSLYYAGVRYLEEKYSKQFGWLLGYANKPEYKG